MLSVKCYIKIVTLNIFIARCNKGIDSVYIRSKEFFKESKRMDKSELQLRNFRLCVQTPECFVNQFKIEQWPSKNFKYQIFFIHCKIAKMLYHPSLACLKNSLTPVNYQINIYLDPSFNSLFRYLDQ